MNSIQELTKFFDTKYAEAKGDELYDVEKARAICLGYALHYLDDEYETLAIEQRFSLPIYDVATGERIQGLSDTCSRYAGIIDAIVRNKATKQISIVDHKTVSKTPDDDYWVELQTNPQLTTYMLAARQLGLGDVTCVWDVITKPTISPKQVTKAAKAELENGTYCGMPYQGYAGEEKETAKMYSIRALCEYQENPARFFWRRIIKRTEDELFEFLKELKWNVKAMNVAPEHEHLQRRNLYACKGFNRLCEFHALCAGLDTEENGYRPRESVSEDRKVEGISPSRLGTFVRCQREYHYRYTKKIERIHRRYDESLTVGSLVHAGLELFLHSKMAPDAAEWRSGIDWLGTE